MAVGPSTDGTDDRRLAVGGVLVLSVVALVARFLDLGGRVAHWDEGRVAWWILDYAESGEFSYRPIIHGPFYEIVTPLVFDVFGATDATLRYVPALLTGLVPLSVLLLRDRFDTEELLALAFFLALNPLLLYYGRFMRGDPLVGAFMFVAFLLFVRFVGTRSLRYLFAGVVFVALGFTVKENAPVYVLCWLGGVAVYGYLRLFAARTHGETPIRAWLARRRDRLVGPDWPSPQADGGVRASLNARDLGGRLLYGLGVAVICLVLFFAVIVLFYAPRGASGVTVGTTLADPLQFPALVEEATVGSFESFMSIWINSEKTDHAYLPYLVHLVETMGAGALVVGLLAVVGFLLDSVREGGPRPVVVVAFLWGVASLLGYPIITDIKAPWAAVNVVLPLTIPAAVALGAFVRWGRRARASDDLASYGLAALVVVLLVSVPTYTAYQTSFVDPQADSNDLVQYAQPAADIHPEMAALELLAERNEGTDVVIYGSSLVDGKSIYQRPSCTGSSGWFNSLPLPWYLERADAETACAEDLGDLRRLAEERPPVVVSTADQRSTLEAQFSDYTVTVRTMRSYGSRWVFLVDTSRLPEGENPMADVESEVLVDDATEGAVDGSMTQADASGGAASNGTATGATVTAAAAVRPPTPSAIHYG
ncbi:flippase activity-associated protein Agl23 [Halomarina rubra]|uniref:Flippase activity-associated protein Agl23 n=1 Tax=Halomarina rubra TaxID=2071873 RepID=A0ABD6ARV7_9EURY|nr:flippase activity-associated protein Agl23 [Halomarina rubra]